MYHSLMLFWICVAHGAGDLVFSTALPQCACEMKEAYWRLRLLLCVCRKGGKWPYSPWKEERQNYYTVTCRDGLINLILAHD